MNPNSAAALALVTVALLAISDVREIDLLAWADRAVPALVSTSAAIMAGLLVADWWQGRRRTGKRYDG